MGPYFIVTVISCLSLFLGGYCWEKGVSKFVGYLFCGISITLICLFAGFRDSGVGTDTLGYGNYVFYSAVKAPSFSDYMETLENAKWEIGFLFSLQGFLSAKITHSIVMYYATIELLIIVPVFLSIKTYCRNRYVFIPMLFWLLVFYPATFNLMRQFIAVGFALLAYVALDNDKKVRCAVLTVVAYLFHSTAICVLIFFFARLLLVKGGSIKGVLRKNHRLIAAFFLAFAIMVLLNISSILTFLARFSSSLSYYAGYTYNSTGDIGRFFYLFYTVMLIGLFLLAKRIDKRGSVFIVISAMSLLFYLLGSFVTDVSRMNYYALVFAVIPIGMYVNRPNKVPLATGGVVLCLLSGVAYFIWTYGIQGAHEVVPYTTSLFLNSL